MRSNSKNKRKHWSNRFQKEEAGLEGFLLQLFCWIGFFLFSALMLIAPEGKEFNLWTIGWIVQGFTCLITSYVYRN